MAAKSDVLERLAELLEPRPLRDAYNPEKTIQVVQPVGGPSMTRQEFIEECDVNEIMARYDKTGVWPYDQNGIQPEYLDVSDIPDLQRAMEVVSDAQTAFMTLPAVARREFDNDPLKFVQFASDPANLERMREWRLAPPAPTEPLPVRVEVINPPSGDPTAS